MYARDFLLDLILVKEVSLSSQFTSEPGLNFVIIVIFNANTLPISSL